MPRYAALTSVLAISIRCSFPPMTGKKIDGAPPLHPAKGLPSTSLSIGSNRMAGTKASSIRYCSAGSGSSVMAFDSR